MTSIDYTHATLTEIDSAVAARKLNKTEATSIVTARASRDSASGRRAAAWLQSHGSKVPAVVVSIVPATTKVKKGADPSKKVAWATAVKLCNQRHIDATGPNGGPTPAFWDVYSSVRKAQAAKAS